MTAPVASGGRMFAADINHHTMILMGGADDQ